MEFPREISSLDLTLSQQKCFFEKGFYVVSEIDNNTFDLKPNIQELTKAPKTKLASQLFEEERSGTEVYSFLENLDSILKGVLEAGSITEFVGLPGSGKTQLCKVDVINVLANKQWEVGIRQIPSKYFKPKVITANREKCLHLSVSAQIVANSLTGRTVYICTNSDFCITRLKEIISNYRDKSCVFKDWSETEILQNIYTISIMSVEELLNCLEHLHHLMKEHQNITLVVIDSITYPLRLCERKEKTFLICSIVKKLRHLGKLYDFTVVLTNDMTTIVESSGSEVVPCLKDTFYHMINNRILLSRNENAFKAEILKCSSKFPTLCNFRFLDDIT